MSKRIAVIAAGISCIVSVASAQSVTSGIFGFTKVDIPPAGDVNLVGFSFSSDQPIYLEDVFGTNQLVQSTRSRNADKIYIWNGSAYENYFQKPDGLFYDVLSGNTVSVEIASGTAAFLQSPSGSMETNTITLSGTVLMTESEQQDYQVQFITFANPYPTRLDLNSTNVNWEAATANSRSRNADKIYIWNSLNSQYDSFYLDASFVWQPLISAIPDPIIPSGGGAFYEAKGNFTNEIFRTF